VPKLCRSACILLFAVTSLADRLQRAPSPIILNKREYGFMDLKNFPSYFNQTEYVIHGAGSYILDVLAAQWMLQHQPAAK
jgi:hypothetical protein